MTAIDRPYLPGLIALHNSFLANSAGLRFACIVYGDGELAETVSARGIEVLHNPVMDVNIPTTELYRVPNQPMWCRLMLPHWFDCDSVWMDADQVILRPLNPLFDMKYMEPCAAVESTTISHHVHGLKVEDQTPALYAGLIHFNREVWLEQRVTERCFEIMNTSTLTFRFVVQSVLSLVLKGNFYRLDAVWQQFGNRLNVPIDSQARVVHWHGHARNPWTYPMANLDIWRRYA